jgi:hypothetical protein
MLVGDLTCFLRPSPELFGHISVTFGRHAMFFGGSSVLLGVLAAILRFIAPDLCLLPVLLCDV